MNVSFKNIDTKFKFFYNSVIGNFLIEKVFFRKKSFYSLVTFLVAILISQLASFKYTNNLSIKININIENSQGFEKFLWYLADFFLPAGNWFIIVVVIIILSIVFWLRHKELNQEKSIEETLLEPLEEKTKNILFQIKMFILFNGNKIELDRTDEMQNLKKNLIDKQVIVLSGEGGIGKTAIIKQLFEEKQENDIFYVIKAIEFQDTNVLYGHNIQEFIATHENFNKKIFVVDSAEKLMDIDDTEFFKEFLSALIQNNWKIVFTTRHSYLDDLNYEFMENYQIKPYAIEIKKLSIAKLQELSNQFGFNLPSDEKLNKLILNLFYLNEFLQTYNAHEEENYLNFKNKLWNKVIKKSDIDREECFLKLAFERAKKGSFYLKSKCQGKSLKELSQDGLLGKEVAGYFITHDIYEEWALERIIEREFINKVNEESFFENIGSSLAIRRSFRNLISEKLLVNSKAIKPFIEDIVDNTLIEQFWKDEILIAVLLSDYSDTFFENFEKELLSDDFALLKRISFLLRIACKEVDERYLKQYNLNIDSLTTFSMFNNPKGNGWKSFICFVYKHIDKVAPVNFNIILPVLHDWNTKQPINDTTRFATLIALKYYQEGYETDKVIQVIITGALEIEDELKTIFNEVIKSQMAERNSTYYNLIKTILTEVTSRGMYKKSFREPILQLCDLFWFKNPKRLKNDIHGYNEKRYCLDDGYDFKYFPATAYKTPIYWLLKEDMLKTIDFILEFVNEVVACYMEYNENDHTIEVTLDINGSVIKQYHNIDLWTAYRARGNTPYLFESIHMALELFLLEQAKVTDSKTLETFLIYLLTNSKSSSISSIVASVVLAYPEKTFNIALILFGVKEFIIYDNSRINNESIGDIDFLNIDIWDKISMEQTNKYQHRQNSLEALFRNYQFFANEDMKEEEFQKRQKNLCNLLDTHKRDLDNKDTTWRFCLGRIDRRNMSPTVEDHKDGQVISFNPKLDDDLIEESKQSSDVLNERTKYLPFSLWAGYKLEYDDRYKEYEAYNENPKVVVEKIKEIISLSEQGTYQYHLIEDETPCTACCILMRDYKEDLSIEDKKFCKEVLINISLKKSGMRSSEEALNFLPYMMKDFDNNEIKMLLYEFLFIDHPINLDIWNISYEDALSLLIGYLVLKPEYVLLRENKREELYKKERFGDLDENKLLSSFKKSNELIFNRMLQNTIDVDEIKDYEKIDIHTLMKAFEFIPGIALIDELKDISRNIVFVVSSELLLDKKDNFDLQKIDNFISKLAHIVLNLKQNEIEVYLSQFINGFNGSETFSKLFVELIVAQDTLKKYDNFWYIWGLFENKIIELCKDGDSYWYVDRVIYSYLLARTSHNRNIWQPKAKEGHTFKERDKRFFKKMSQKIGHCPSTLYAISKLLTDIGSPYLDDGIGWISFMVKSNKNLLTDKLEPDTIYNIESITRKYILENSQKIKEEKAKKQEILEILNFLVEKGSAIGYMLRERIL